MKYMQNGGVQNHPLMRLTLYFTLFFIFGFWVTNFAMYFAKMNLAPQSVVDYYLGSEEDFTQPVSYQSLLEVAHFHLFSMGILVLILTHLMLFVPLPVRLKIWLIGLTFCAAVANEAGGWLVRFVHPGFAYFKIGAFLLLEGALAALLIVVGFALAAGRRNAYRDTHAHTHRRKPHKRRHTATNLPSEDYRGI